MLPDALNESKILLGCVGCSIKTNLDIAYLAPTPNIPARAVASVLLLNACLLHADIFEDAAQYSSETVCSCFVVIFIFLINTPPRVWVPLKRSMRYE